MGSISGQKNRNTRQSAGQLCSIGVICVTCVQLVAVWAASVPAPICPQSHSLLFRNSLLRQTGMCHSGSSTVLNSFTNFVSVIFCISFLSDMLGSVHKFSDAKYFHGHSGCRYLNSESSCRIQNSQNPGTFTDDDINHFYIGCRKLYAGLI